MNNKIVAYMRSDSVMERFTELLGSNAPAYVTSVLLAVANDPTGKLQECTPESIYRAAIQAATLRLSVDPSTAQAYLVPFKERATLIVGYKGLYDMAIRTGRYRYIHVAKVYQGEIIREDRITGRLILEGSKESDEVVGWVASFEMVGGYAKSIYMTRQEIHEHARKYSRSYSIPNGLWNKATEAMERKTVLRRLLIHWGYLGAEEMSFLRQDSDENEILDGEIVAQASEPLLPRPEEQILQEENVRQVEQKTSAKLHRPLAPVQLAEALAEKAEKYAGKSATAKQRSLVVMLLDEIFQNNEDRHLFQAFAFGNSSLKKLEDKFILAALDWLKPTQDSGGEYRPDPMAYKEAMAVLNELKPELELPYPPDIEENE